MLEYKIQKPSNYLFWFSMVKLCYRSTKWRWSVHWKNWNLRDQFVEGIFPTSRCWTRILLLLWRRSSGIPQFQKKVSCEEQKSQKEDLFLRGTQIAFVIYDYFRVAGAYDTVMDFADCSLTLFIMIKFRKFDARWDEVLCRTYHLMMS